RSKLLPGNINQ
ncbi:hypothetical protein ACN38_g13107, partial [Penicillium nordicum]